MAAIGNDFDATTTPPQTEFKPLPEGKYLARIADSKSKATRDGNGEYIEFTFELIEDGPYKGRKVWARLNMKNASADAVKIARSELSAICHAVGIMRPKDTIELHNIPLVISVKCKKRQDSDELTNVIRGYERKDQQPQSQPQGGSLPPWMHKPAA